MKNKGQGLTLDTIVIAALVVIVLVVLILIFTGNLGPFSRSVSGCGERGGTCTSGTTCSAGQTKLTLATCDKDAAGAAQICCISSPTVAPTTV